MIIFHFLLCSTSDTKIHYSQEITNSGIINTTEGINPKKYYKTCFGLSDLSITSSISQGEKFNVNTFEGETYSPQSINSIECREETYSPQSINSIEFREGTYSPQSIDSIEFRDPVIPENIQYSPIEDNKTFPYLDFECKNTNIELPCTIKMSCKGNRGYFEDRINGFDFYKSTNSFVSDVTNESCSYYDDKETKRSKSYRSPNTNKIESQDFSKPDNNKNLRNNNDLEKQYKSSSSEKNIENIRFNEKSNLQREPPDFRQIITKFFDDNPGIQKPPNEKYDLPNIQMSDKIRDTYIENKQKFLSLEHQPPNKEDMTSILNPCENTSHELETKTLFDIHKPIERDRTNNMGLVPGKRVCHSFL